MASSDGAEASERAVLNMEEPLLSEEESGVELSRCVPEIELVVAEKAVDMFVNCTINPGHEGMTLFCKLKAENLPFGHQTEDNLKKIGEHAKRTVRVEVEKRSENRPKSETNTKKTPSTGEDCENIYGTGFLFPGGHYVDKPCPCRKCGNSASPRMEYHVVYVMTARHVVFDEFEARNVKFSLFYDERYTHNVKTICGLGMAGEEENVCCDDKGFVVAVVENDGGGDEIDDGGSWVGGCGNDQMDGSDTRVGSGEDVVVDDDGVGGGDASKLLDVAIDAIVKRGVVFYERMFELKKDMIEFLHDGSGVDLDDVDCLTTSNSNSNSIVNPLVINCLWMFVQNLSEGKPLDALDLAKLRLSELDLNSTDSQGIKECVLASIRDMISGTQIFHTIPKHVNAILDQCKKLNAIKHYFLSDGTLYDRVTRLSLIVRNVCNYIMRVLACIYNLSVGKFNSFVDSCSKLLRPEGLPVRIEQLRNIPTSDEKDVDESECKVLSEVSRFSEALLNFLEKDSCFFLNLLIPVFVHEHLSTESGPCAAVARFWNFFHNDFQDIQIFFQRAKNILSYILDGLYEKCHTGESERRFLAALHYEICSVLKSGKGLDEEKDTAVDKNLNTYKTDRVLVKCVTHKADLIELFKTMKFSPPTPPFTFIISHPHGYYKHVGFGKVMKMPVEDCHCLCVVTLGPRSKFRLTGNGNFEALSGIRKKNLEHLYSAISTKRAQSALQGKFEAFINLIQSRGCTKNNIELSPNEEFHLNCQLTLAFSKSSIRNYDVAYSSSSSSSYSDCWLTFPSGTICIRDGESCDSIALPDNLEFCHYYNAKDVLSSLRLEKPFCFTHNVPTCEGSSGSLISTNDLVVGEWHTHCASYYTERDSGSDSADGGDRGGNHHHQVKVGLTSIKPHGWMVKRKQGKMAVKEYLDIRPNAFVGPTPLKHHSAAPFQ